jgi:hypothetical protein
MRALALGDPTNRFAIEAVEVKVTMNEEVMTLTESHIQLLGQSAEKLRVQAPPLPKGCEELARAGYVEVVAPPTGSDLTVLVVENTDAGRGALKEVD